MGIILWALRVFYELLTIIILVRCFGSFFIRPPFPRWYQMIIELTEPMLAPCRNLLYRFQRNMSIDFSPVLALLFLSVIYRILYAILYRTAF